jgi:hypothetical protein
MSPDEVNELSQFIYSFQLHHDPVYSASNRNEFQKILLGVKRGWHVRLSKKCGILDISQPYRPPQTVM